MTGWAYEKLGQYDTACRYFRRFLELAPAAQLEGEKADHANGFMADHCPALQKLPFPDEEHSI
jgi:hypothetical protein